MARSVIAIFVLVFLGLNPVLKAQNYLEAYFDVGKTQVSDGGCTPCSLILVILKKTKWGVKSGYQLGLVQPSGCVF